MNSTTRFVVTLLGGWLGIHKFIEGKTKIGIMYLLTFGLFGIGWIIDLAIAMIALIKDTNNTNSFPLIKSTSKSLNYDMDTLEGINSIPVPAQNYNTGDWTKDCIYYVLQRKATEHKKNGRLDLAIACLRKSNALSDYELHPLLTQKDYLRLVKYIEYSGDKELARAELKQIYDRHPEFLDKRISNIIGIRDALKKNREWKNDCVMVSTNNHCPFCSKYNLKVFSISGKTKKYPKLPQEIIEEGGFCPDCYLILNSYFDGISTPPKRNKK